MTYKPFPTPEAFAWYVIFRLRAQRKCTRGSLAGCAMLGRLPLGVVSSAAEGEPAHSVRRRNARA